MKMNNSKLVDYTKISPNSSNPRTNKIKKITIHHMAGNMSVESCGAMFARPERRASSNYAIGSDGRVAMYVEEKIVPGAAETVTTTIRQLRLRLQMMAVHRIGMSVITHLQN